MSKRQKDRRRAEKAEQVWEARQVAAAAAWQRLRTAEEAIEANRDELSDEQYAEVQTMLTERRSEVRDFLMKHRDLYVDRMNELGRIPTPMVGRTPEEEFDYSLTQGREPSSK